MLVWMVVVGVSIVVVVDGDGCCCYDCWCWSAAVRGVDGDGCCCWCWSVAVVIACWSAVVCCYRCVSVRLSFLLHVCFLFVVFQTVAFVFCLFPSAGSLQSATEAEATAASHTTSGFCLFPSAGSLQLR